MKICIKIFIEVSEKPLKFGQRPLKNGLFQRSLINFFIITFCLIFSTYAAEVADKIVAIVNDEIITQSELEEFLQAFIADYRLRYGPQEAENRLQEAKSDALNRLIEERLILQEAKRRNIVVDEAEINERLNQIKSKFGSDEEFQKAISESGLTTEALKNRYKDQLMMRALVDGIVSHNVQVSPTQIAAYYYGHKNEFTKPEKVRFRIVILKFRPEQEKAIVKSFAEELLRRMRSGEDFAKLAKQYSEGPNVEDGGDMGFVLRGEMAKEIDDAIFSLNANEVSDVIETPAGCNIVKIEEKIPESEIPFEEAMPATRDRLFGREAELILREFIDKLKKNAYIESK